MSIFRSTVWFVKGLREYTKGGYASACKNFDPADLEVSAADRSYMITGANSGLGKAAALALAQKGGTVHLVCRNKGRGEEAKTEIVETTGNQVVFQSVFSFISGFECSRGQSRIVRDFCQSC